MRQCSRKYKEWYWHVEWVGKRVERFALGEIEVDWVLFPVFYWVTGVTCD
jgi:hypothetical protein